VTKPNASTLFAGLPRSGLMGALLTVVLAIIPLCLASAQTGPSHPRDAFELHGSAASNPVPAHGDLDAMRARHEIRVLVPYSRTVFFFDRGEPRGFAFEVFSAYERFLNRGVRRGQGVKIIFIPVPRDLLLPWLIEGRGDIAAGRLTITPERTALVDFSDPVDRDVSEVPVTRRNGVQIESVADLSGVTVHVRPSSSYHASLVGLNAQLVAKGRPPAVIMPLPDTMTDDDVLEMLQAGLIDATILDSYLAPLFGEVFSNIVFHHAAPVRTHADIAWAIRKESPLLRRSLSQFLTELRRGSNTLAILERRYFVENRWIRRPIDPASLAGYKALLREFVSYGQQYKLDWAHLLAQGYQESGLNQKARNPSGAVGIMQILPGTAASAPISLPDVHLAEVNIHAGTRYMRHLLDVYFDEPGLAAEERFRFALAGYNAGPNRIRRLRQLTQRAGLDPNVWYGNVEITVARHVGQETVAYVSNIENYLYAFRAIEELAEREYR